MGKSKILDYFISYILLIQILGYIQYSEGYFFEIFICFIIIYFLIYFQVHDNDMLLAVQ